MKKFGKRLRELRKTRHLSQEKVAYEIGVAPGTISRYESGRMIPTGEVICEACRFFRVSADYLLGLSDIKVPNKDLVSNYKEIREKYELALEKARKYETLKEALHGLESEGEKNRMKSKCFWFSSIQ